MLTLDLSIFPNLHTDRLVLRELVKEDALALHRMRSDERVMRHIPRDLEQAVEESERLIATIAEGRAANNSLTWGITMKDGGGLVGTIGYYRLQLEHHRGEIGYLLHPDHWGKGFASEAMAAALDHGFQAFRFHSIEAVTDPENHASNKLLERSGFTLEAHFRENYLRNGKFLDSLVWSKLTPRSAKEPYSI
ncbi:MAG: GNAT family N-acetyltransferase [Flavobacteriales bacterium]|nr:GNAT family N-acetyltransferase [Flavobacteriales bacterium]